MPDLTRLKSYLSRIPDVWGLISSEPEVKPWWLSFRIDPDSPRAWNIVQELAHICNSPLSPLLLAFKPTSPPPYLNGGPREFLSWDIVALVDSVSPDALAELLEEHLPRPVDDLAQWTRVGQ